MLFGSIFSRDLFYGILTQHRATKQSSVNIKQEPTDVVEAAWGQPLREVGGKQEAGEEGEEEVVTVAGQGVGGVAAAAAAEEDLQTGKHVFFFLAFTTKTK